SGSREAVARGGEAPAVDAARAALLNLEARGGRRYWQAIAALLRPRYPEWPGRRHQEAQDPINAALSYGYAILAAQVHLALLLGGLDPSAGFLHADRPGKLSLVYDAMEEFRQAVVDRPLLGLLNRGLALELEGGRLRRVDRRRLAMMVLERLRAVERHEGRRLALRAIIARQAEQLATFVRRERASYVPFVARW